jgi:uncharacterized Tic20 family protein
MDDQDHITGAVDEDENPAVNKDAEGEGVPIPSRIREAVADVRERIQENPDRDVVKEYEERYYGSKRLETPPTSTDRDSSRAERIHVPRKKAKRIYDPVSVSDNERKWAAIAHGSTLLTALLGILSGGALVLLTMFVPLFIYFSFRKRSEFVAFHALQAFTIQLVGTIGWIALLVVGTLTWVALLIVSALLILVLVGIILLPLVILAYPVFIVLSLALPLGMVIYSVIAMVETHAGRNYRIPYISRWVESQMYNHILTIF